MRAGQLRLRVRLARRGMVRFLSHTEFWRTVMLAARRSGLPLAYTEGHRPRMKISLSPPLPIGTTSDCELFDLSLERYLPAAEAGRLLASAMPGGIEVIDCRLMGPEAKSVGKLIDTAEYRVTLPAATGDEALWSEAVAGFLSSEVVEFERVQPRRTRVVNLREGVHALEVESRDPGGPVAIRMTVDDGTRGTIKPREVITVLAGLAGVPPGAPGEASFNRECLYQRKGDRLLYPMEQSRRGAVPRQWGERGR